MTDPCCEPAILGAQGNDTTRLVRVKGFVALWHGRQPLVGDIGADAVTVEALVRQGRLEVDATGRLVAIHGLAARPTAHRIEHPGGTVQTWCAFDAVGIPAALGIDALANLYCDDAHLAAAELGPDGSMLTLSEVAVLGRSTWLDVRRSVNLG